MTRINCVPPQELHQKHLVAEYRELPRVFALAHAAMKRGEVPTDPRNPKDYVLGSGHVRFFYPRQQVLVYNESQTVKLEQDMPLELAKWFGAKDKVYAKASFKKGLLAVHGLVKAQAW